LGVAKKFVRPIPSTDGDEAAARLRRGEDSCDLPRRHTQRILAEALGLTWDRVDHSRGVILLEVTKSHRGREVPLNRAADDVLVRRVSSGVSAEVASESRRLQRTISP
jgi:integrase